MSFDARRASSSRSDPEDWGSLIDERVRLRTEPRAEADVPLEHSYGLDSTAANGGSLGGGGSSDPPAAVEQPISGFNKFYADASTVSGLGAGEFVDGVRTAFTLAATPADNSLVLANNGQLLHEGVHFTRSGAALTITFAPQGEIYGLYALQ